MSLILDGHEAVMPSGVRKATPNEEKGKRSVLKLLAHTKDWLLITAGSFSQYVYDEEVIKALKEAWGRARPLRVKILVGPNPDEVTLSRAEFLWDCIFVLPKEPALHFAVGDGIHVRYEGPHSIMLETPKNCIALNAPESASVLVSKANAYLFESRDGVKTVTVWRQQKKTEGDRA